MVQGMAAVKWTPENNAKLLAAIVCLHPGALDLKKLASVFGPNVPNSAIAYRMGVLRKEGAALGLASNGGAHVPAKSAKRVVVAANNQGKSRKSLGGMHNTASDDDSIGFKDETEADQEATPPDTDTCDNAPKTLGGSAKRQKTLSGRVTKPRFSPRKSAKKDYKALEDPFLAMDGTIDGDGNKLFDTDKSDSEDTLASDSEFTHGGTQETNIKMEEAV